MGLASYYVEADLQVRLTTSDEKERVLFDLADFNSRRIDAGDVEPPQPARRRTEQLRTIVNLERAVVARTDIEGFAHLADCRRDLLGHAARIADELDVATLVRALQA